MSKRTTVIGLDIGTSSIKLVELMHDAEHTKIVRASVTPVQDHASTVEALKNLIPASEPHGSIRVGVAGPSVLIRRIQLPSMTAQELKGAIRFEAESHIPFPMDECYLDYHMLGQKPEDKMMSVLLVAAKRDFVTERFKTLEEAGLRPDVVDSETIALTNAFRSLSGKNLHEMKTYGLLHIGRHVTLSMIVHQGEPFFAREMSAGVDSIDKAPAELYAPLLDELTGAVEFFESTAGDELKHLWISGGGALVKDAGPYLTEQLGGRQAALWGIEKPLAAAENADLPSAIKRGPELAVAFGLALARQQDLSK